MEPVYSKTSEVQQNATDPTPLATSGEKETDTNNALKGSAFLLTTYPREVKTISGWSFVFFLFGLIITALWAPSYWVVSVLCSSACMSIGWLLGFLFGVPRVGTTTAPFGSASAHTNTNLEQLSDWLTKILVGVGLTQIAKLPHALAEVARLISNNFGKSGNDVFSGSLVLYFSTLGFLMGYLLTRLFLQRAFEDKAEGADVHTTGAASITVTQPDPKDATAPEKANG